LHVENKVMPIVESDRMLSNGEQKRIVFRVSRMWEVETDCAMCIGITRSEC